MKEKVLIEYTNPFNGTRVVEWVRDELILKLKNDVA